MPWPCSRVTARRISARRTTPTPSAVSPPGLGSVAEALRVPIENGALEEYAPCGPCADPRGVVEDDLAPWVSWGGAAELARQAEEHDPLGTF